MDKFNTGFICICIVVFIIKQETAAVGNCPGARYECAGTPNPSEEVCVGAGKMCDGTADCDQGDDEDAAICEQHCADLDRWWCARETKCLQITQLCDRSNDCTFVNRRNRTVAVDERNRNCRETDCTGRYTRCGSKSLQCIRSNRVCDDSSDCFNGWDEGSCNASSMCNLTETYDQFPFATPVRELSGEVLCEAALNTHNYIRGFHRQTGDLKYDLQLARTAEEKAMSQANVFGEGSGLVNAHDVGHSFDVGELTFLGLQIEATAATYMSHAVFTWYNAAADCNYNYTTGAFDASCNEVGDVMRVTAQVLWANNEFIGCGAASANITTGNVALFENPRAIFIVCHYLVPAEPSAYVEHIKPLKTLLILPS